MRYLTAAFGSRYAPLLAGMLRSFEKSMPGRRITVYTDVDPIFQPSLADFNLIPAEDVLPRSLAECGDLRMVKVGLIAREIERGDICWIDCDNVVLGDLELALKPGFMNVVSYGVGGRDRACGNGLVVPQEKYLISGLFSIPDAPMSDEFLRLSTDWLGWPDRQETFGDQGVVNNLANAFPHRVNDVTQSDGRIFNFGPWLGHPSPRCGRFTAGVLMKDGKFMCGDVELALLSICRLDLEAFIRSGFSEMKDSGVREFLSGLYGQSPKSNCLPKSTQTTQKAGNRTPPVQYSQNGPL